MDFKEKLRRRAAEVNKSKAAKAVGLRATTISNYIAKGSIPRADIALKIARALDVPLEWLVDDAANWPPPDTNRPSSLDRTDPDDLVFEVSKLQRRELLYLSKWLDQAEKLDWEGIAKAGAGGLGLGGLDPSTLQTLPYILSAMDAGLVRIEQCDPRKVGLDRHEELPGAERPKSDFAPGVIEDRYETLMSRPAVADLVRQFRSPSNTDARNLIRSLEIGRSMPPPSVSRRSSKRH